MIKLSGRQPPVLILTQRHTPETINLLTPPSSHPAQPRCPGRSLGVRWLSALRRIDRVSSVNRLAAAPAATPSGEILNEEQQQCGDWREMYGCTDCRCSCSVRAHQFSWSLLGRREMSTTVRLAWPGQEGCLCDYYC